MPTLRKNVIDDERFADIAEGARMSAVQYLPAWNDLNAHDPGVMLVELMAWLVEGQRFYMDRSVTASAFFPLLGITPRGVAASRVALVPLAPLPLDIPAGTVLMADEVRFELWESYPRGHTANLYALQRHTICGGGVHMRLGYVDGFSNRSVQIDTRGQHILRDGFVLRVADDGALSAGEAWTLVDSFRGSKPSDRHYTLDTTSGIVTFGDGHRGLMPKGQVIVTEMALTRAEAGNITAGWLAVIHWAGQTVYVSQPEPSYGGAAAETITETLLRLKAEQRQAVTAADIAQIALETPDVPVCRAKAFSAAKGSVTVAVQLDDDNAGACKRIRAYLEDYRPAGCEFHVVQAKHVMLDLSAEVYSSRRDRGFATSLEAALGRFIGDKTGGIGGRVSVRMVSDFLLDMGEVSRVFSVDIHCNSDYAHSDGRGGIVLDDDALAVPGTLRIKLGALP